MFFLTVSTTRLVPLESLTLSLVSTEPLGFIITVHFSHWALVPTAASTRDSVYLTVAAILGQWFALCPLLSSRSKKSCRFCSLFSFSLVFRIVCNFQVPYMWSYTQAPNSFCSSGLLLPSQSRLCRQSVGSKSQRASSQVCFSLAVLSWARNVTFLRFRFPISD